MGGASLSAENFGGVRKSSIINENLSDLLCARYKFMTEEGFYAT